MSVGSNVESIYVEKLGGSLSKDDIHKILVEGAIEVSGGLERFLSKQELRDENTDLICTSAGM
ncbi:hypothetical protein JHK87_017256 [Glycine soja]|nr:hypothetical protein JHK87_017256 [Glycine soja]